MNIKLHPLHSAPEERGSSDSGRSRGWGQTLRARTDDITSCCSSAGTTSSEVISSRKIRPRNVRADYSTLFCRGWARQSERRTRAHFLCWELHTQVIVLCFCQVRFYSVQLKYNKILKGKTNQVDYLWSDFHLTTQTLSKPIKRPLPNPPDTCDITVTFDHWRLTGSSVSH